MMLFIFVSKAKGEYSMYLIGESFTWEQDEDVSGRRKNQGILYGIGALGKWNLYSNLTFKIITETKGNRFDRNIKILMIREFDQDVEFLMIRVSGDIGYKFKIIDSLLVEPFFGFGYRRWMRDVEESPEFPGYTQIWRSHYGRIGLETEYTISEVLKWYLNGGIIIPIQSRMKMNKDGKTGRVNFNSIPSEFFETGIIYKKLEIDLYFESIRFPPSKDTNYYGYRQPKSKADMLGIKIGIRFN
jgi:hypothetical protein